MAAQFQVLLANAGAGNGASSLWLGGPGMLTLEGTIGGATIAFQVQTWNGAWVNYSTPTAAGASNFDIPIGVPIRVTVTGGTPSGIYAYAIPLSDRRG